MACCMGAREKGVENPTQAAARFTAGQLAAIPAMSPRPSGVIYHPMTVDRRASGTIVGTQRSLHRREIAPFCPHVGEFVQCKFVDQSLLVVSQAKKKTSARKTT